MRAGHQPVPAKAGAEQVLVLLIALIINEVHKQSPLKSGTIDLSTLGQLIVVSQGNPFMYKALLLCVGAYISLGLAG